MGCLATHPTFLPLRLHVCMYGDLAKHHFLFVCMPFACTANITWQPSLVTASVVLPLSSCSVTPCCASCACCASHCSMAACVLQVCMCCWTRSVERVWLLPAEPSNSCLHDLAEPNSGLASWGLSATHHLTVCQGAGWHWGISNLGVVKKCDCVSLEPLSVLSRSTIVGETGCAVLRV